MGRSLFTDEPRQPVRRSEAASPSRSWAEGLRGSAMALRVLLAILGALMAWKSRRSDAFITSSRDVTIEIGSDDGVARPVFREPARIQRSRPRAEPRLRASLRDRTPGILRSSRRRTGRAAPLRRAARRAPSDRGRRRGSSAGFKDWSAAVVPGSAVLRLPATPPGAYVKPSSSPEVSRFITREPPERGSSTQHGRNAVESAGKSSS